MRRSGVAGAGFVRADGAVGLAVGSPGSAAFLMGSAVFAEAGAAARVGAGRAGAVARAGITGAIGLPAARGFAAATIAGLP